MRPRKSPWGASHTPGDSLKEYLASEVTYLLSVVLADFRSRQYAFVEAERLWLDLLRTPEAGVSPGSTSSRSSASASRVLQDLFQKHQLDELEVEVYTIDS